MYSKFNIKKEKELIILNYYIEMNLDKNIFSKSIREIANDLDINKNRAQKLILELQDKNVIEKINSNGKSKSSYLYKEKQNVNVIFGTEIGTDFRTGKTSKINVYNKEVGTDFGTDFGTVSNSNKDNKINKYKNIIIEIFGDVNKVKIDSILEIQGLETIELDLFKNILKESILRATKNPISYAYKIIMNTIKDNITTLEDREYAQNKRIEDNYLSENKTNFNYMDSSEKDDFEMLAKLTRNR